MYYSRRRFFFVVRRTSDAEVTTPVAAGIVGLGTVAGFVIPRETLRAERFSFRRRGMDAVFTLEVITLAAEGLFRDHLLLDTFAVLFLELWWAEP